MKAFIICAGAVAIIFSTALVPEAGAGWVALGGVIVLCIAGAFE